MRDCCQAAGIEETFDRRVAARELKRYRKAGAEGTTRILLEALTARGIEGMSLLDIGGGVGVLQHELLEAGLSRVVSVDASSAYLEAARTEAERRGHSDRIEQRHGDFVELEGSVSPADIVTLDRVICCYDAMEELVGLSARLAGRFYGAIYPHDDWWVRAFTWIFNLFNQLRRSHFRTFAHPTEAIEALIRSSGLQLSFEHRTILWRIQLYTRDSSPQR